MATSIPPHNLGEVVDALVHLLNHWDGIDDVTVADLLKFIQGPDFPTGGIVFRYRQKGGQDTDAIANAYGSGKGRVTVRAKAHVEQMGRNKSRIVITELPYQANKTNLLGRIADLHRDGKIEGLTDLRDESDRNGMRIILETTRNVQPEDVLADLFRLTPMQSTFSISLLALVNSEPRLLTLKQALRVYLEHRYEIIQRRSEHDLEKARARAHILEGLLIALDNLDEIIALIRKSRTVDTARKNLIKQFKLTQIQAQAILDMQLRRLAALERKKIQEEFKEIKKLIAHLENLLSSPEMMRGVIKDELLAVRDEYADVRRTQIVDSEHSAAISSSDLLPDEKVWVMVGEKGTIARTTSPELVNVPRKPAEQPLAFLEANTQDILYLFAANGTAVSLPVYQLPQSRELGNGTHWADLTAFSRRNHLASAVVVPPDLSDGFLFLTTLGGVVKRVRLDDLPGISSDPFAVMNVSDDDSLGWVKVTDGSAEAVLVTASGQAIRFKEEDVRAMGLPAGGVYGIKLSGEEDGLVAMDLAEPDGFLWSITDNGLAKATPMSEYPVQGRHGQGVINMRLPKEASEVVTAVIGDADTLIIITTAIGTTKKLKLKDTYAGSRAVKPRAVMTVSQRNRITGAVRVTMRPELMDDEDPTSAEGQQLSLLQKSENGSSGKKRTRKKKK